MRRKCCQSRPIAAISVARRATPRRLSVLYVAPTLCRSMSVVVFRRRRDVAGRSFVRAMKTAQDLDHARYGVNGAV